MATRRKDFAVCLKNKGYEVSLERWKIYEVLPDPEAASLKRLRMRSMNRAKIISTPRRTSRR